MTSLDTILSALGKKQIYFVLCAFVILVLASIGFTYTQRLGNAKQAIRFMSRMVEMREGREVALTLEQARLDYFKSIQYSSSDPNHSFIIPEIEEFSGPPSFVDRIIFSQIKLEAPYSFRKDSRDVAIFTYNRFAFFPHAVGVWALLLALMIPQSIFEQRRMKRQYEKDLQAETDRLKSKIMQKVRHNLRNPLTALIRLTSIAQGISDEDRKLFRNLTSHIKTLVSELGQSKPDESKYGMHNIYECIHGSLNELRLLVPPETNFFTSVEDSVCSAIVNFEDHELKAILSNLVTNSSEAIVSSGKIGVEVLDIGSEIEIRISDNGRGVRSEHLNRLGEEGFSFGKPLGTGKGVHHAQKYIGKWGGRIRFESTYGIGTRVTINLPIGQREPWYSARLKLTNLDKLIIVDDHLATHELWRARLREADFRGSMQFYFTAEDARIAVELNASATAYKYFVDYDLGADKQNGIDFLSTLPSNCVRHLVTGCFDSAEVQSACAQAGLTLIPKTGLAEIPIVVI